MKDCTKEFRNIVGWCANEYKYRFANHAAGVQFCHPARPFIHIFVQKSLEKENSQTDVRDCTKEFRDVVGWRANEYKYKYKFANHAASVQFCHPAKQLIYRLAQKGSEKANSQTDLREFRNVVGWRANTLSNLLTMKILLNCTTNVNTKSTESVLRQQGVVIYFAPMCDMPMASLARILEAPACDDR